MEYTQRMPKRRPKNQKHIPHLKVPCIHFQLHAALNAIIFVGKGALLRLTNRLPRSIFLHILGTFRAHLGNVLCTCRERWESRCTSRGATANLHIFISRDLLLWQVARHQAVNINNKMKYYKAK
jgi:hypothetical protein